MKTSDMFRAAPALLAVSLTLLVGCSDGLSGTYGKKGEVNFEFHPGGKVDLDVIGPVQEASYVVEDGKVKISNARIGTMVMKFDADGCLDGGAMMGKLCKQ